MQVAALYDIHGNLPALEAVLLDVREAGVDEIVVGGDVLPGPMPRETIGCLMNLDIPVRFIRGNGDRETLAHRRGQESGAIPETFREAMRWVADQILPEDEEVLSGWPATLQANISGLGDVFFCHATPRNDTEVFGRLTPEDRLLPVFDGVDAPLVICGHTHMQFDRRIGNTRVVNAGSVGMPCGKPGACWLRLGPDVQFRTTQYDLAKAAERVLITAYPQARYFAEHHVLERPSEDEMMEFIRKVEIR